MITNNKIVVFWVVLVSALAGTGCTGWDSFSIAARAGDTVAISLGWQQELTRQDIKVKIRDHYGNEFTYEPGDPAVRAIFNSYPDPVSNLIVGKETGQGQIGGSMAGIANSLILGSATNNDKDYMQTFLVLDLPTVTDGMLAGMATIDITDPQGNPIPNPSIQADYINPVNIEILAGEGSRNDFLTQEGVTILPGYLKAMERSPHYTVSLDSATIPHAVQLDFTHDPDLDNGGVGRAYVVNPRGDLKTINWADDGSNLKVIIMPARDQTLTDMRDFKFYVAGGVTGLTLSAAVPAPAAGFNINGASSPDPITVSINP